MSGRGGPTPNGGHCRARPSEVRSRRCNTNVYGPHQDFRTGVGLIAAALRCAQLGRELAVWGDGTAVRDYVYVEDVCEALIQVGLGAVTQRLYNVGSGTGVSVRHVLSMVSEVADRPPRVKYAPGRAVDAAVNVLAIARLRGETGWHPRTPLRDGMARTWAWLREAGAEAGGAALPEGGCSALQPLAEAKRAV